MELFEVHVFKEPWPTVAQQKMELSRQAKARAPKLERGEGMALRRLRRHPERKGEVLRRRELRGVDALHSASKIPVEKQSLLMSMDDF